MNYYPHHIGDYLRDTSHLTALEDGLYRRMLDVYYASEKPLPIDQEMVSRLVRARSTEEREAVSTLLGEFFDKRGDGWHNKRADSEIKKGRARVKAAITNGKRGGRPITQRVSKNNPVGGLTDNPDQSSPKAKTKSQKEIVAKANRSTKSSIPDDFSISPRVRLWAEARGVSGLEKHLEHFIGKCKAKDYRYVDWDEGFMGAIRDDWAKLGQQQPVKVDL